MKYKRKSQLCQDGLTLNGVQKAKFIFRTKKDNNHVKETGYTVNDRKKQTSKNPPGEPGGYSYSSKALCACYLAAMPAMNLRSIVKKHWNQPMMLLACPSPHQQTYSPSSWFVPVDI